MFSKFDVGDVVDWCGEDVEIIEVIYAHGTYHYMVAVDRGSLGGPDEFLVNERNLEWKEAKSDEPPELPKIERKCKCGAWTQRSFEEFHSSWCPEYRDKRR